MLVGAASARAQSFNLDAGTALGLPADTYGGAADNPGVWQALDFAGGLTATLSGLDGQPTAVTITASQAFTAASAPGDAPTGDDAKLVGDYLDLGVAAATFEVAGLEPGRYRIVTYAWKPDDEANVAFVSIRDDNWAMAGAWPGSLTAFVTHADHEVEIAADATLVINVSGDPIGVLNGLQIVKYPDDPPPVGDPRGFNLDGGTMFGQPSARFGAASGQEGVWMALSFHADNPVVLDGLDGQPSTVTVGANLPFGPASFAHDGPAGDEEKLLEDYLDLHSTGGTFEFKGVPAGDYVVYTYAWGPDNALYETNVTIGDDTRVIGGAWPGGLVEGITHARHEVTVPSSGKLTILTFGTKGTLNGIQIVPAADDQPIEPSPEVVEVVEASEPVVEVVEASEPVVEVVEVSEPAAEIVEVVEVPEPGPEVVEVVDESEPSVEVVEPGPGPSSRDDGGCAGGAPMPVAWPVVLWGLVFLLGRRRIGPR